MIKIFKEFFLKRKAGESLNPQDEYQQRQLESLQESLSQDLSIDSLTKDFDKRSSSYGLYQHVEIEDRHMAWIGSINYSGYTREDSLRWLIDNYVPGDENRILLRLCDWVPQIQKIAQKWTLNNFTRLSLEEIRNNTRLILYLSRKEMLKDDAAFVLICNDLMSRAEKLTQDEFFGFPANFRKFLCYLCMNSISQIREWIFEDPEPSNRKILLEDFESLTTVDHERLKIDKSNIIRRHYIRALIDHEQKPDREDLLRFVFEETAGMRSFGRFHLKYFYDEDAYEIYKQATDDKCFYLADFAKEEDLAIFKEGAKHPDKKIQLISLKALCKINPTHLLEQDYKQLLRKGRAIRGIICEHLAYMISEEELLSLKDLFFHEMNNGLQIYLNIIDRKSYWAFVELVLNELIKNPTEELIRHISYSNRFRTVVHNPLSSKRREAISNQLDVLEQSSHKDVLNIVKFFRFDIKVRD